jgi:phosphoenolpyruvate phosphomutase
MQRTARNIFESQSLVEVEDRVAPLAEVFRLQGEHELEEAEKRYLPVSAQSTRALILAASRGKQLGELTSQRPVCMVEVNGVPILGHILRTYRAAGIRDIAVVRGYHKEMVHAENVKFFDDEAEPQSQASALHQALPALDGPCLISFGDVLFKKYIAQELMDADADFVLAVDSAWQKSRNHDRYADYVTCSEESGRWSLSQPVRLLGIGGDLDPGAIHAEWMGLMKVSSEGARILSALLTRLAADPAKLRTMNLAALLRELLAEGKEIRVIYGSGNWLDIDSVEDLLAAGSFQ